MRIKGQTGMGGARHKILAVFALLAVYLVCVSFTHSRQEKAAANEDATQELGTEVEEIVEEIDLSELEAYLATLSGEQLSILAPSGIKNRIKAMIGGNMHADSTSFLSYIGALLGENVLRILPTILAVIAIAVAFNVLSSLRGKFAADSVQNIVYFACVSLLIVLLFAQVFAVFSAVKSTVQTLQKQMRLLFPILLTLMTAIGAGSSVAVYRPGVAILSSGIASLITAIVLPAFIVSVVLTAIGHLTDGVKLGKLSDFFGSASKWLLGTAFFLVSAFMAVQGITASVYDGVSVRTAKFALSKYVPVIGGYLSDGLNLVMSGSVLVKNAVGSTAMILLFLSVLPIVVQIVVLSLGLRFAAAVSEPLGDSRISGLIEGIAKNLTMLVAVVLAVAFLYFIFLVLIVCTGNLAI
ncbi:MAG: stage III sporulation protein AE [Clostridiales bacterium]|nr:stage III sporulation protein AE [Clostridiales bacterium]